MSERNDRRKVDLIKEVLAAHPPGGPEDWRVELEFVISKLEAAEIELQEQKEIYAGLKGVCDDMVGDFEMAEVGYRKQMEAEVERLGGGIKKAHRMLDAGGPSMACDDELCPHDPKNCAYAYLRDEIDAQAALDKPNG